MNAAAALSVEAAAARLGYGKDVLYERIKAGDFPLPVIRLGRTMKIPASQVEFYAVVGRAPESTEELVDFIHRMNGEEVAS